MKCPFCKHNSMICTVDPEYNWLTPRKCLNCGKSFTPLRLTDEQFVKMQSRFEPEKE